MKCFSVVFILMSFSTSFAQEIEIKAANSKGKAALFSLSGEKSLFIDSIFINSNSTYKYNLHNDHPGFYRLSFNENVHIGFINDDENVEISSDTNNILDSLKIIKSESNKIFYNFIKLNKEYKTKTELLEIILANYPSEDDYYQITKDKLRQLQNNYLYFVNLTSQVKPNSFIAKYVRTAQLPVIESDISSNDQLSYLKTHALDKVNFNDDELVYSDAFTNKTIEYLTYYRNPQLTLELLEKEFIIAVDTILNKAKVNEIVYTHIVEYLLDGFKKFGFDNVLNYIVDNYLIKDDLCLDEKLTSTLDRRIQQSRNFKVGNIVPDIILPDSSGSEVELNKINFDKILILFYASWCPHCQSLLPIINNLYKNQREKEIEVLAVSIDTSRIDWLNFIRSNKFDWLNVSDLKGWNGKAASGYYLYATPTIFLIDNQKKIILNSPSIEELNNLFK